MKRTLQIIGLLIFAGITLAACAPEGSGGNTQVNTGKLKAVSSTNHDWGDINIRGGKVDRTFTFTNTAAKPLYLKGAQTSCMCTTARYHFSDDSISPMYGMHTKPGGWSQKINPNETFDVEVIFDPMAHGPTATGPIRRTVSLFTSDPDQPAYELTVSGNVLSEEEYLAKKNADPSYANVSAAELKNMLTSKDFFLLDVHIPEQEHIEKTDAFIDYRKVTDNLDQLPDKDAKIVVYCRSGSMSQQVAQELSDLGYTNVVNLTGGRNAFVELNNKT